MPGPKAVVWDVGHVLYDWDPRFLYAKLIPDADRLDWFLSNVVTRAWHFQHDAGRPFAETSAELIAEYPAEAELIAAYGPRWLETIPGPIPGTHELVEALAAAGIPSSESPTSPANSGTGSAPRRCCSIISPTSSSPATNIW